MLVQQAGCSTGGKRKRDDEEPGSSRGTKLDLEMLMTQALLWTDVDAARERVLVELAADNQCEDAMARCLCLGWGRCERDEDAALELLIKIAENRETDAVIYYIGECYHKGRGTDVDFGKAVEWYQKGAAKGIPIAQTRLGLCYREGNGVEKDIVRSAEWISKAADVGYAAALSHLGFCYQNGRGVDQDIIRGDSSSTQPSSAALLQPHAMSPVLIQLVMISSSSAHAAVQSLFSASHWLRMASAAVPSLLSVSHWCGWPQFQCILCSVCLTGCGWL